LPSGLFGPGVADSRRASDPRPGIPRSKRESNPAADRTMGVREIFGDPRAIRGAKTTCFEHEREASNNSYRPGEEIR
jgi:hypothetical protein